MKRLSILFVGLLSAVLVFSAIGFATDYDSADVSISFTDAIVLDVSGSAAFDTISQSQLEDALNNNDGYLPTTSESIQVDVTSLTSYNIGVSFQDDSGNASDGLFQIDDAGSVGSWTDVPHFTHSESPETNVGTGDKPTSDFVLNITGGDLPGTINWPTADSDTDLSLRMDPSDLGVDVTSITSTNYHLDFWVYSGSIPTT